jgi:hypothetical protein
VIASACNEAFVMTLGAGNDVFGFAVNLRRCMGTSTCVRVSSWLVVFCVGFEAVIAVFSWPPSSSSSKDSNFLALNFFFFGEGSVRMEGVKALYFAN